MVAMKPDLDLKSLLAVYQWGSRVYGMMKHIFSCVGTATEDSDYDFHVIVEGKLAIFSTFFLVSRTTDSLDGDPEPPIPKTNLGDIENVLLGLFP